MTSIAFIKGYHLPLIHKHWLFLVLMLSAITINSQESIASKLGYPADARLLIIHADDLGVAHSENAASIKAIEDGVVNSASVMMPTPWVLEVAEYAKAHPETHDFGLHLVLTSEWKNYRWGPVASIDKVPTLINEHGYFHAGCKPEASLEEVEVELRAQIDRAFAMGLVPTHLDSHMGCLMQSPELIEVYLRMGQEYKLPVMVSKAFPEELIKKYNVKVVLEEIVMILPKQFNEGLAAYYNEAIKNLKPGVTTILIHTAYDNDELKAMTIDHPEFGSAWRQKDYDYFTSEECKELLEKENIKLVTWRQLKEAYFSDK
ncbi:polysaccharide deacetylase family protein [Lutimonas sp.]|uniref:polysaccharide deacetylase family protein n=1 Tax=Lutimonas sp. TaxID=1872403 RepID=UPI003D9B5FDB